MRAIRAILIVVMTVLAPAALACAFHTYAPQETVINKLVSSEHIVLARPDPKDPFRYIATEAIVGGLDNVEIPYLVPSSQRRRLALYPRDTVLFAFDENDRRWQRLAYVDAELRSVIDHIAARLPAWRAGDDEDRLQAFVALLDHDSPEVRAMALRELDLGAYGELRGLDFDPDAQAIIPRLGVIAEFDLLPIRILLLGLSGDDNARIHLVRGLERSVHNEGRLLGAYATAWIELDGTDAVNALAGRFLADESVAYGAREMIVEAMAIHASVGAEATRSAARAAVSDILARSPGLAPAVARQFGSRGDWTLRDALAAVLKQRVLKTPNDVIAVSHYIALGAYAERPISGANEPGIRASDSGDAREEDTP